MKIRHIGSILLAILLGLVVPPPAVAEEEGKRESTQERLYRVEYLDEQEAALFARQLCLKNSVARCDSKVHGRGFLAVWADEETLDMIDEMLARRDVPPKTQVFQVTLLVASHEGRPDPDLPPAARDAVDDILTILPFRGYRVLDIGIMRTSDEAHLSLGGDLGYEVQLRFRGDPNTKRPLFIERFRVSQSYVRWIAAPPSPDSGGDASRSRENVSKGIVSASFSMDVGETVVVGTSKLDGGDEALVILLTALDR